MIYKGKKFCPYHDKMEPISNFYENRSNEDGLADQCKVASNMYTDNYVEKHRDAVNEKSNVNAKYYANKISRSQQVQLITKINNKYGITTRIK